MVDGLIMGKNVVVDNVVGMVVDKDVVGDNKDEKCLLELRVG